MLMIYLRVMAVAVLTVLVSACASHPEPIIDTKGVNMAHYEADLADCTAYGDQVHIEKGVAKGTAGGAAVGAATGAIFGEAAKGAGVGAIGGGAKSARRGEDEKHRVVKNCLRGRGYKVLN